MHLNPDVLHWLLPQCWALTWLKHHCSCMMWMHFLFEPCSLEMKRHCRRTWCDFNPCDIPRAAGVEGAFLACKSSLARVSTTVIVWTVQPVYVTRVRYTLSFPGYFLCPGSCNGEPAEMVSTFGEKPSAACCEQLCSIVVLYSSPVGVNEDADVR